MKWTSGYQTLLCAKRITFSLAFEMADDLICLQNKFVQSSTREIPSIEIVKK